MTACLTNEYDLQDAVVRGWFRTVPDQLKGAAHLRVIGLTALEIAVAMKHLHDQGVLHGVSGLQACRHYALSIFVAAFVNFLIFTQETRSW